ncbi:PREDICTED: intracellular protein transport protein USO1-like [Rhagoletis zephyria]|uniref:intracellular protein transport protein USO1-like n=1 Tax=Rhagoletis zephyria TaxID=28612 RepID=UPI0008118A41|nr:PREDICTED: intracellular protein transport protein USO1-like [Rhagoletis zephyria]
MPLWSAQSTSKAAFGQTALFQPSFVNPSTTHPSHAVNKTTEKNSKYLNSTKAFGENYFDALDIQSQSDEAPKNDKPPKVDNLSKLEEDLKTFTKELYKPKKRKDDDLFEKVEILEEEKLEMIKENDALKAENEKLQVSLNMQKIHCESVYKELESVHDTLSSNQAQLDSFKDAHNEFETFKRKYPLQQTELRNKVKQKIENLQSEKVACQIMNQRLEGTNQEMKLSIKGLEGSNLELKSTIEGLEDANQELKAKIKGVESVNQEMKLAIKGLEGAKQEMKTKVEGLEGANLEMGLEIENLEEANKALKLKIEGLESANNDSKSKMEELESANHELNSTIESLKNANEESKSKIEGLEGSNLELKSTIEGLEDANKKMKSEIENLEGENLKLKSANVDLEEKANAELPATCKSPVKGILKSPGKNDVKTSGEMNPVSPRNKRKLFIASDNGPGKSVRFNEQKLIRYGKSDISSQQTGKSVDMSFVKKSISAEPKRVLTVVNKIQDKKPETVFDTLDEMDCFMDDF